MNPKPKGFLCLDNRYVIKGKLQPEAALHIGSGLAAAETDACVARDVNGPFIPASSLRGVMRSRLERILQALGKNGCVLFEEGSHTTCLTANQNKEWVKKLKDDAIRKRVLEEDDGLCDICRLFGSPFLASKLKVEDCRPEQMPASRVQDGVGIDRDTETAREKIKFDYEVLEKGPAFSFHIEMENARSRDFALLGIVLTEMAEIGIDMGGRKARGLGRIKLHRDLTVCYFDKERNYGFNQFLLKQKLEKMSSATFWTLTQSKVKEYLEAK